MAFLCAFLSRYNKAYHYLIKVHSSTAVDPAALKVESERLTAHRAKLQEKLEPMKPLLGTLHFVKRCVDAVIEDQQPPSILAQLEAAKQQDEAQRQARQEEEQRRQYEQNKSNTHLI